MFAWRKTPILVAEFVGFIAEYPETLDLMYIRRAAVVSKSGHLVEQAFNLPFADDGGACDDERRRG